MQWAGTMAVVSTETQCLKRVSVFLLYVKTNSPVKSDLTACYAFFLFLLIRSILMVALPEKFGFTDDVLRFNNHH
jgi:hypothetical protein